MGGKALAHVGAIRYRAEEYFSLADKILLTLESKGIKAFLIPSYIEKETFGDCDILVESETLPNNWNEFILEVFNVEKKHSKKNGNCFSILVNSLQVDLIATPKAEMISSLNYFSENDLGNLIGRQSKMLGLKFSHYGLSLIVRCPDDKDRILGEILLETDNAKSVLYEIFGIQNRRVKNPIDMFELVASSKFFMKAIYYLENRNSDSRRRDKLRANYRGFLEWIAETKPEDNHSFEFEHERNVFYSVKEPYYSEIILPRYPWVADRISEMISSYKLDRDFKKIYNGEFVQGRTGYIGKELGEFMKRMKDRYVFDDETKRKWIDQKETLPYVALAQLDLEFRRHAEG